ncbi:MAG: hypothetical protein ACPHL6_08810 [Rubripirellula sp.]
MDTRGSKGTLLALPRKPWITEAFSRLHRPKEPSTPATACIISLRNQENAKSEDR